jgi:hypothetical protein
LANNGGTTQTHALLSRSHGLAAGNNKLSLSFDQRGAGILRTTTGEFRLILNDMGAYQMQRGDIIFDAGFDGCL